ncbi:hypothetical protein DY000_02032901 [Brassica cretica]|uniref:Uncharacterized protein n=1 Tax=Brassica cretica TaxID=69181 RepID=A0ABQ7DUI4_BRACR|nr:hypothetical protein DY000_02032901 [Brassica cretica]
MSICSISESVVRESATWASHRSSERQDLRSVSDPISSRDFPRSLRVPSSSNRDRHQLLEIGSEKCSAPGSEKGAGDDLPSRRLRGCLPIQRRGGLYQTKVAAENFDTDVIKDLADTQRESKKLVNRLKLAASQTGLIDKMTQRGLMGHVADQEIWDGRVEDPPTDQKKTDATTAEEPLDIDQFDSKLVCNSVVDVSGAATTNRAQE